MSSGQWSVDTKRLKKLRLRLDLKQSEVAKMVGLSVHTYGEIERGKVRTTKDRIRALANFYCVSESFLTIRPKLAPITKSDTTWLCPKEHCEWRGITSFCPRLVCPYQENLIRGRYKTPAELEASKTVKKPSPRPWSQEEINKLKHLLSLKISWVKIADMLDRADVSQKIISLRRAGKL